MSRGSLLPCAPASDARPDSEGISDLRMASLRGRMLCRMGQKAPLPLPPESQTHIHGGLESFPPSRTCQCPGQPWCACRWPTPFSLTSDLYSSLPLTATPRTSSPLGILHLGNLKFQHGLPCPQPPNLCISLLSSSRDTCSLTLLRPLISGPHCIFSALSIPF